MPLPAFLPWAPAVALVAITALVVGLAPQPLLARLRGDKRWLGPGLRLSAAAGMAGFAAFFASVGLGPPVLAGSFGVAAACLTAVAIVDARHLVIPDLYVVVLLALAILQWGQLGPGVLGVLRATGGAALGGGLLILVRWGFRQVRGIEGLGFGDVKLMFAVGALVGPQRTLWIILGGAMIGVVWLQFSPKRREQGGLAPFGAAAAVPALIVFVLSRLVP